ncbi:MAG: hypothetical protein HY663_00440 [Chloroflexi bacterium]|nr:hypothetical protein [Chloroflexota bacterium]
MLMVDATVIARSPPEADDVAIWEAWGTPSPPHRLLRFPPAAEWSRNDITNQNRIVSLQSGVLTLYASLVCHSTGLSPWHKGW